MRAIAFLPVVALACLAAACGSSRQPGEACASSAEEALNVCAAGTTTRGVDVSTYQGAVDWTKVKAAGIEFAFARVSDGTANPDDQFAANWKGMKAAGVVRGVYQFGRTNVDPTAQANLVASSLAAAGGFEAGDLPVVMDIETNNGESSATIVANMKTWLDAVKASTGKTPIIYTSEGTYPITSTTYDTYDLWVANYTTGCPIMPVGWTKWVFWQNSSTGTVGGITGGVDTDEFNGTLAQLTTYAGAGAVDAGGEAGAGGADGGEDGGSSSGSGSSSGAGSSSGGDAGGAMGSSSGGDAGAHAGSSSGGSGPCSK
jgi:lysozyme